nr:hypothetical protein Iba_chr11cCG10150 [Ipomoea batatas]
MRGNGGWRKVARRGDACVKPVKPEATAKCAQRRREIELRGYGGSRRTDNRSSNTTEASEESQAEALELRGIGGNQWPPQPREEVSIFDLRIRVRLASSLFPNFVYSQQEELRALPVGALMER